jgi:hypothetical protein
MKNGCSSFRDTSIGNIQFNVQVIAIDPSFSFIRVCLSCSNAAHFRYEYVEYGDKNRHDDTHKIPFDDGQQTLCTIF